MEAMKRLALAGLAALAVLVAACSSDGGGDGAVYMGGGFYYGHTWYDNPYYWYDDPDYIVVDPPERPDNPDGPPRPDNTLPGDLPNQPQGPVRPDNTLPGDLPNRPSDLPSQVERPGTRPTTGTADRSRMPAAQPRISTPRARPSIPAGGRRMGGGRRR